MELWNNKASFDFFMDQKYDKNIKILEIWCNIWTLNNMIYSCWYKNILWIDVNKNAINIWKDKYKNIKDNINYYDWNKIPFTEDSFDLIISFDVIEHIPDLNYHLKEVNRILKKWWIYLWQTPNKITNIPWEIINNKSLFKWKKYHCSLQTLKSLEKIFNKNWFKKIEIKKIDLENDYNIKKVKNKLWLIWILLLKIINKMPLVLQTNFWFNFIKK